MRSDLVMNRLVELAKLESGDESLVDREFLQRREISVSMLQHPLQSGALHETIDVWDEFYFPMQVSIASFAMPSTINQNKLTAHRSATGLAVLTPCSAPAIQLAGPAPWACLSALRASEHGNKSSGKAYQLLPNGGVNLRVLHLNVWKVVW